MNENDTKQGRLDQAASTANYNASLERLLRLVGPRRRPPEEMEARVREGVYEAWQDKIGSTRRRRWRWVAAAASVVMVTGLVLVINVPSRVELAVVVASIDRLAGSVQLLGSDRNVGQIRLADASTLIRAGSFIQTGRTGRAAFQLTQGVSIRLDQDTRLQLISQRRLVLEHGAVYVDTRLGIDPDKAIEVVTAIGKARDIGTQFEVRMAQNAMEVKVREGTVAVDSEGEEYESRAGERISLGDDGNVERENISSHGDEWAWVSEIAPPFNADGKPVVELLNWAARETGRRLQYSSPECESAAGRTMLRGSLTGMTPEETLSAHLATTKLRYDIVGEAIVVDFR